MDNLTHSLVGAVLGQMGLKTKTGLAVPTLVIAANLPDIDAACVAYGQMSLAMRRGITHGPIALVILPILLWATMIAFDRWQTRRGTRPANRPPIDKTWLLALAYIGCLSHPALDWLNNYGIRLLEPFSHRWFYGDTLFIIDLWIWIALGLAVWLSVRRERTGRASWTRPAWIGFSATCGYIFLNGMITGIAERDVGSALRAVGKSDALVVVASPPPLMFWRRDVFWRTRDRYGSARFAIGGGATIDIVGTQTGMDDARVTSAIRQSALANAFLFWSRMPVASVNSEGRVMISDQRYQSPLSRNQFAVEIGPIADDAIATEDK